MRAGLAFVCASWLAACLPDNLTECADGRLCPAGTACDPVHVSCVSPAQSTVCTGVADGEPCTADNAPGICDLGVCLPGCGDGTPNAGEECDDGNFVSHDGCSSACVREQLSWQRWQSPWLARVGHAAAYHAAAGLLVVFGGHDGARLLADHWQRSATGWSAYTGAQPPARRNAAMTYDSMRQRIILFGGVGANDELLGDTWEFDGSVWTQRAPANSPSPREGANMAYDSLRNRTIMFGGASMIDIVNETWEYNGTTWSKITTTGSPAGRVAAAMAWNPVRQRVMMFGGIYALFAHNDTWEYNPNNSTWTSLQDDIPADRGGAVMAFSTDLNEMVLFGGHYGGIDAAADTWVFTGLGWSQVTTGVNTPPGRFDATLTQDTSTGKLVMVGGARPGAQALDDVWVFDGNWQEQGPEQSPTPRVSMVAVDEAHQTLSLFAGVNALVNDFWQFDGTRWTRGTMSPTARFHHTFGYDVARDRTVMFGGFTNFTVQDTTEERDGTTGTWSLRTETARPPGRGYAGMAYEPSARSLVMFGGELFGTHFGDTWELTAAGWTQVADMAHPPDGPWPAMTSDPVEQRVLVFDSNAVTWSFANHAWTRLDIATPPPARYGVVLSFDRARGRPVLYGGYEDPSTPQVWELADGAWHPLDVEGSQPPTRETPGFVYDRWRHMFVLYGGYNASGYFGDTWFLQWRSTTPEENCSNGIDDDDDHHVDASDPDC